MPCRAVAGAALAGEALPTRIKLFNWGTNEAVGEKPFVVNERTLASLAANQEALGFDRIALDYNHQSVPGHPNFKPDPREHAAFGSVECVAGDGLYFTSLAWTPSGEANARNYADLSPTPLADPETGEVLFIHSVALCTQGKVKGLHFLSADFLSVTITNPEIEKPDPVTMDPKKLLLTLLGLPDTATDEEITAAAKTHADKMSASGDNAELKALSASVQRLLSAQDEITRTNLIEAAVRAGKLIPASVRDLPTEHLQKVLADLPENVVPLSARTPAGIENAGTVTALSASDREVCARLGISEESFKKANGIAA